MVRADFIVGILGNIFSVLTFAAPLGTFRKIVKKKSAENFDGVPYMTTLLSTSLWTLYGLLDPDRILIITVNSVGVASQLLHVTLFLIYAPLHEKVKSLSLLGTLNVGVLGAVIAATLLAFHGSGRRTFVGVLCATVTIVMYATPLKVMGIVIRTKSVEYMPFFLSFFLFLNAGVWFALAMLVKDNYVLVPNAVGILLGSAQLIVYMIYKNKALSVPKSASMIEENGSHQTIEEGIEMQDFDNDNKADETKNQGFNKQQSLRSPSISKQYSLKRVMKTLSLTSLETQFSLSHEEVENGGPKDHP